ncbi:MAG TPA: 16S rRNA (guanine(966)-N(2))-methyltransferase RsmD [Acidimicrobiia bacterium]
MRIIAGAAKGRRLVAPDSKGTRPVTDRVREAVFSIVGSWVEDATVLDLYAGSGSFGLEALSRGAVTATFVENGAKALAALRRNLAEVGLGGTIVSSTVSDYLGKPTGGYDLVFMDPPWDLPTTVMTTELGRLDLLLASRAEVVVSRRHSDDQPLIPVTWAVATDRRYGDTRIFRYAKESETP